MIDIIVGDNDQQSEALEPVHPKQRIEKITQDKSDRSSSGEFEKNFKTKAVLYFMAALILYVFLAMLSINGKYVDFGDGNYLYLSWRLSEGDVLYKDLPSPQPPFLLFWGSFLVGLLDGDPTLVRLWQIMQHALTACCVWGIAARLFNRPLFSAAAGSIYLFLPEGVWWAAGYQSEPLLILLQCFNLLLFLTAVQREGPSGFLYASAFVSALCAYVNMTAAPYIALQWFFVWLRFRRFLIPYSLALVIPGALIFIFMWIYSGGQYIEHVFFRQVGTYPANSVWGTITYFISKLYVEGGDIIFYEGGFVLASLLGMLLFYSLDRNNPVEDYMLWWAIFSLGSIIFVTKGGTVEYIFTLGEPAVAVFSAYFLLTLFAASDVVFRLRSFRKPVELGKCTVVLCFLLPVLLMKPLSLLIRTFSNGPLVLAPSMQEKGVFELSGEEMEKVRMYIQRNCPENKTLVAPPYYAFHAKRKLAENSSSLFILVHAYYTEWERLLETHDVPFDLPGRNDVVVYRNFSERTPEGIKRELLYNNEGTYYNTQSVYDLADMFNRDPSLREEFPAIALFLDIRRQIMNKEVGLIVKNMTHFFFYVPPLHQAIRDFCVPIEPPLELNNREEHIVFYKIK
ncbi:MAG: glycosyltransferase family 39 protein [Candidatus Omnitrophica bacterium]|nr:glycosyltransferase family 39 protein [Candidatus Omnitrophota bacterium]